MKVINILAIMIFNIYLAQDIIKETPPPQEKQDEDGEAPSPSGSGELDEE